MPGLKVVLPSTPYDYKGLLKTAIRDPNPVVFIEHKMLYRTKGTVPAGEYAIPLGVADVKRQGRDVTVVALGGHGGQGAGRSRDAEQGRNRDRGDRPQNPGAPGPGDHSRLGEEDGQAGGVPGGVRAASFGSEIARAVGKAAFDYLEAPIEVVGTTVPLPFSPPLEAAVLPGESQLISAVRGCLGR